MFTKTPVVPKHYQRLLEEELERALRELAGTSVGTEEYVKTLTSVERLNDMMAKKIPSSVSKDTLANIGANLIGIFMILQHERLNVISRNALGFVIRTR